jgi:2-amino-4-hydroxy-6-hydroxymethyldihydropteridine diphosphokinase
MEETETTVYLSLGSNIEPRLDYLHQAIDRLHENLRDTHVSSIYETEPWGYTDQGRFLNLVIEGSTSLPPLELLQWVKQLETDIGRRTTFRYGPREIDIDILLFGDQIIQTDDLIIPHPRLLERAFVLIPLCELSPDLVIPGSRVPVAAACAPFSNSTDVRKVA